MGAGLSLSKRSTSVVWTRRRVVGNFSPLGSVFALLVSKYQPPYTHYCHPSLVAAVFSMGHSKLDPLHRQDAAATHSSALPLRPDTTVHIHTFSHHLLHICGFSHFPLHIRIVLHFPLHIPTFSRLPECKGQKLHCWQLTQHRHC